MALDSSCTGILGFYLLSSELQVGHSKSVEKMIHTQLTVSASLTMSVDQITTTVKTPTGFVPPWKGTELHDQALDNTWRF